jgi:hypothetical protein
MTTRIDLLILPIALAAALCACNTQPGDDAKKFGTASNSCGPADGPATSLHLTDAASDCGVKPDRFLSAMIVGENVKNLKVGNSGYAGLNAVHCNSVDCVGLPATSLDVQFTDSTGAVMLGTYKLWEDGKLKESGPFEFKKCLEPVPLCG